MQVVPLFLRSRNINIASQINITYRLPAFEQHRVDGGRQEEEVQMEAEPSMVVASSKGADRT